MKIYAKILWIIVLSLFVLSCEKYGGRDMVDIDSDAPEDVGKGNSFSEDKSNVESGTVMGDDYGDLYVLNRDEYGVPVMNYWRSSDGVTIESEEETSAGIWYAEILSFDADGNPDGVIEPNSEGEFDLDELERYAQGVEFGRINIVRSPPKVLKNALEEAISTLKTAIIKTDDYGNVITDEFGNSVHIFTKDASGRLVAVHGSGIDWITGESDDSTIDSPRESMAIYKELMEYGADLDRDLWSLLSGCFEDDDLLDIAASAFAAGSDKSGTILLDEIVYVNGFLKFQGDFPSIKVFEQGDNETLVESLVSENVAYTSFENYDYYNALEFYKYGGYDDTDIYYGYKYNRNDTYGNKKLKIITEISYEDGEIIVEDFVIEPLLDHITFTYTIDNSKTINNLEGFTIACDDAVQVLDYIHGNTLIEYAGED